MSAADPHALEQAHAALAELLERSRSLMLATLDAEGRPEASYAPFLRDDDGMLYIFVSALARHTANLKAHPEASVLIIEDESSARQIFARRRLSWRVTASPVPREAPEWGPILERLAARCGEIVHTLRSLPDFVLYRLQPQEGSFVMGFGRAYRLTGPGLEGLEQVGPPGGG